MGWRAVCLGCAPLGCCGNNRALSLKMVTPTVCTDLTRSTGRPGSLWAPCAAPVNPSRSLCRENADRIKASFAKWQVSEGECVGCAPLRLRGVGEV